MECNKDEAVRAKEIAEKKFMARDYAGGKKFALKAQNLYPELDGLSQMLTAFDVHISAENRTSNGEVDWYCVLGVNPCADDETVRKQYHKLALMLHPDRNKSVGADDAFKLVSEAWGLLSDKEKRRAYNQKLNPAGRQGRVSTQTKVPSAQHRGNGFHNHNSTVTSHKKTQNKNMQSRPTSVPSPSSQKPDTFWTICSRCMMHYEYLRVYLNHNLLCPNCHQPFLAVEKDPPSSVLKSPQNPRHHATNSNPFNSKKNGGQNSGSEGFGAHNSTNGPNHQWSNFNRMNGVGGKIASTSTVGHAESVVQKTHDQLKREQDDAQAATEWEKRYASKRVGNSAHRADQLLKRRRYEETGMNNHGADVLNQAVIGNGGAGIKNSSEPRRGQFESQRVHGFSDIHTKSIIGREMSLLELRNMLMKKGLLEAPAPLSINVPDPDFHNFDLDRTESSFGDDQVWAAYDENDGMPRYYARIHSVISLKPFKMKISWLNSRSNSEFGLLDWVGSGFLKTCGDFWTGRHEISKTLNSFSHRVTWSKGARGVVRILPKKGDVWALYRNWSPDWNEDTPDEVVREYEMVEVLDDYDEEQGISAVPLIKAKKLIALRRVVENWTRLLSLQNYLQVVAEASEAELMATGREADKQTMQSLSQTEVSRMVDDASITREMIGSEDHTIDDPAAISSELPPVITEVNIAQMEDTVGKAKEEMA
ncbi:HEAT SHOCK PROTEIN-LIKE [Salix viminalis]|uniref:HEAT SHOCK PROTEIN-LIKE n=1 Tax=Salix viminalis TaxID=40686 RepID=A0A9Q0SCV7_SALVM|nr:HEAT SHOCK PROTEIN-LIKE [Salix viminalis]